MSDTTQPTVTVTPVADWPIEGLEGREGRYLTVTVPPGLHAPLHHHDGWQFIYVLDGAVVSQMDGDGEPVEYRAGDAWYEPRGRRHVTFGNETDRPATVLVFFLTEPGVPVLTFDDPVGIGG